MFKTILDKRDYGWSKLLTSIPKILLFIFVDVLIYISLLLINYYLFSLFGINVFEVKVCFFIWLFGTQIPTYVLSLLWPYWLYSKEYKQKETK